MSAIADKIHHIVYALALTIVGTAVVFVWGYVELRRPVHSDAPFAVATESPTNLAKEVAAIVQGTVQADRVLAASNGTAPTLAQPAITVLRDVPGGNVFTPAQWAQILAGLKAPTREVVGAKLIVPKPSSAPTSPPGWTDAQVQTMIAADKVATESVINDPQTHIPVTLSQEERESTRIGSMFTPSGSGLGYAAVRHGHFEIDLGAIIRDAHLSPALQPAWLIPHTAVACGPAIAYDKRVLVSAGCTVHF